MQKQSTLYTVRLKMAHETPTYIGVVSHELMDLKAGTYHKLVFPNDVILYINDFGVQSVLVTPDGVKTNL
jgi:hypothetical protein